MRRFGTIFPFLEQGSGPLRMGRLVANHDFAKALLKYGSFDQYYFSNPSLNNLKSFQRAVAKWNLGETEQRIKYVSYSALPALLGTTAFQVFHLGGWGYFMPGLHYLRNQYASNPWPITGVIHSLNGKTVLDQAVRLCHAGMAPYDSIFCTSKDGLQAMETILRTAESLAGKGFRGRLDHLPLGLDDEAATVSGNRGKTREGMRIPDSAVVLLMLGRITPMQKMDPAPLLAFLSEDPATNSASPLYLIIAGGAESQDLQVLKERISYYQLEERVRVRANFPVDSKADLLAAADIFLALSDNTQETFGLSLLEAQAAGLPVVASRFDGFKDLVRDGIDGFLIDTYWSSGNPLAELEDLMDPNVAQLFQAQSVAVDLRQLSEKLSLLVSQPDLRRAMGEIGRAKVLRDFVWSRVVARYERLWDQLALEAARTGLWGERENPYAINPFALFGHYASRPLLIEDRVERFPCQRFPMPYEEIQSLVSQEGVERIRNLADPPLPVGELLEKSGLPQSTAWFVITWMIKYNMLRVQPQQEAEG